MNAEDAVYDREGPACAVRFAADLELFKPRQGEGCFARSPLEIEVSLGEQDLRDEHGFGFSLRFRRVIVALTLEGCDVARQGRYERTLPAEDFAQFLKRVVDTSRFAKAQGRVGSSKILSNLLSALGIELSAQAEVAASLERGNIKTIESKVNLKIVRFVANTRWEIGHPQLGDPSAIDTLLRGMYFNKPADGRMEDEYSPLCYVEPLDRRPYTVTIELRVKKADCVYVPLGNESGGEAWEKKNKTQVERLLAVRMLEELNRADGLEPPEGEIILARARLIVKAKRRRKDEA
jgi:hypothetical protein